MSNIQITENESGKYSPDWFYNEAQIPECISLAHKADELRENFINLFGVKNHDLIFLLQNNITYIKKMFYDRDIKNVLNAIGIKNIDTSMKNITIKKIFLHAILSILHNEIVLDSTIQELKLPFKNHSSFYKDVIQLIDKNMLDIDTLLNSLILNNIASIDKSLQFND